MTDEQRKAISVLFEEPISNNGLIAQFMGIQVYQSYEAMQSVPLEELKEWRTPTQLAYDLSWSELMPVIEKIEALGYDTGICHVMINGYKLTEVLISPQVKSDGAFEVHLRNDEPKLVCTYKAVVDFIKMYNLQNRK